jgi:hypothetical protein
LRSTCPKDCVRIKQSKNVVMNFCIGQSWYWGRAGG